MEKKKSIFITGAASGIGRETALLFGKKGWFVGIVDVNEEGLKTLQSEIGEANCFSKFMDVTDSESVQKALTAFTEKTGGQLDVIFNNAGIIEFGHFESVQIHQNQKKSNHKKNQSHQMEQKHLSDHYPKDHHGEKQQDHHWDYHVYAHITPHK